MKYSKSAIGLLTREYRSVLKKCLLINLGLFALGITSATPASAEDYVTTDWVNTNIWKDGVFDTSSNSGKARIWNETDGGGVLFDTVPGTQMTGNEVFVGVHGGDAAGEFVNLYAKDGNAANTKRIILNTTGAYYLKSNGITTTANDEIATVGAVGSAITTALTDYTKVTFAPSGVAGVYTITDGLPSGASGDFYTKNTVDTLLEGKASSTHTHAAATTTTAGFMSATDKSKLDGIESGAEANVIEGVQVNGVDLSPDASKKVNVTLAGLGAAAAVHTHDAATTTTAGFMSATDKSKLDGISTATTVESAGTGYVTSGLLHSQGYATTAAMNAALEDKQDTLVSGTNIKSINSQSLVGSGNLSLSDLGAAAAVHTHDAAVASVSGVGGSAGFMSAGDKEKLDGITTGGAINSTSTGLVTGQTVYNNAKDALYSTGVSIASAIQANAGAIETLNGDATTSGSVAKSIADALANGTNPYLTTSVGDGRYIAKTSMITLGGEEPPANDSKVYSVAKADDLFATKTAMNTGLAAKFDNNKLIKLTPGSEYTNPAVGDDTVYTSAKVDNLMTAAATTAAGTYFAQDHIYKVGDTKPTTGLDGYVYSVAQADATFATQTALGTKLDTATFNGYLVGGTGADATKLNGANIGAGTLAKAAFNTDLAGEFNGKLTGAQVAYDASAAEKAGSKFYTASTIDTNFVAKVDGKGLSTEDYTTAEKTKLAGIAAGAEVNVIDAITVGGAAAPISGKTVALGAAAGAGLTTLASAESGNDTVYTVAKVDNLLAGKSNTGHTHASSDVTEMTGYSKGSASAAIAATDSLNTAIGKLEYKADTNAANISTNTGAINTLNGGVGDAGSVLNSIRGNAASAYFDPTNTAAGTIKSNIEAKMNTADWVVNETISEVNTPRLDGSKIKSATVARAKLATDVTGSLDKADSAIQSVKVNGTPLTPDSDKAVDITAVTGIKLGSAGTTQTGVVTLGTAAGASLTTLTGTATGDDTVYSAAKAEAVIANAISAEDTKRFSKYNDGTSDLMPAFGATETVGQYLYENAANALYDPSDATKGTIKSNIGANATAIANALAGTTKFTGLKLAKNGTTTDETQTITSIDVDLTNATTTANSAIMATKASVARDIKDALSDPTQDIVADDVTANTLTLPKTGTTSGETVQVSNITTSKINSSNKSGATLATAQSVYEALGKVDKLITHNDTTDKDEMDEDWAGKSHNVVSGEYRGNLAVGTTVADDLIELDNVFGKMQNLSGTDLVAYNKATGAGNVAENLKKLNDAIHGMTGTKESVTFGDAATTTTMGNTNAKIVLSESGKTATVTAANGLIVDGKVQGGSFANTNNTFTVSSAGEMKARNFTINSGKFSVSNGGSLTASEYHNGNNSFVVSSSGTLTANEYHNSDNSFVVTTTGDIKAASLSFDGGASKVNAIDTGATAVSGDGSATTMATTATVMKSAANGKYDNTTSGLTATTIQAAIDENASNIATSTVMDANATSSAGYVAGDKVNLAAKLLDVAMKNAEDDIDDIEYILGPAQTTEATSGILTGKIIGGKDTVTPTKNIKVIEAIDLIAKKAAGLDTANVFTNLNVFKYDGGIALQDSAGGNSTRLKATAKGLEVDRTVVAEGFRLGDNTVTSIDVNGSAVGVAAANASKMATGATVYLGAENANYSGGRITGASGTATIKSAIAETAGQVNTNTGDIATIEGKITVPAASVGSSYVAITAGDAVGSNLVALDSAVGAIQTSDTKQNKQLDTLATEIGGSYATDGTFTHTAYTSTNNISATDPITTAISSLDSAIGDASTLNSGIAGYTGTQVVGAVKQLSANLTNGTVNANFGSTTVDSLSIDGEGGYGIASNGAATFSTVTANSVTTNSLKIGDAAAITSTTTGLDMGGNTLENVGSLSFGTETTYVNSIDDGSAAKTSASANNDTTMATVATVLKSAENAEFNAADATSAALNGATTIKTAIDNVAAAVDSITDGMGNVAELAAQADTAGSNINNPVPGSSPIHATTVVSAIKDLDNAIGNIQTGITHDYAKNGAGAVPSSVAGIIQQMAENIDVDIHGDGAGTDVVIGENADTTTVGKVTTVGTDNYLTGLQVDTTDSSTTVAAYDATNGKMLGMEVDAKNQKIAIGDSADDAYGLEMDTANGLTTIGDGTDQTRIGKGTLEIGKVVVDDPTDPTSGTHFEAGLHMDKDHITLGDMTTNGVALDATNGSITTTGNATVGGNATITGNLSAAGGNFNVATDTTGASPVTTMTLTGDAGITGDLDVGGDADITGAATVGGTLDVTGKTTLSTTNGMAFGAGQTVTSIDDGSAKATITPATTTPDPNKSALATVATVLKSAENAEYDNTANTGVVNTKGATTLHQAISVLDDAMGDMVLNTANKNLVDGTGAALDNATDALNALDAVMGNITDLDVSKGNLDGTKKEVASHLAALDTRLGLIKAIDGGAKGNLAAADSDVATHFNSVDVAMGDRTSYNNTANFTGYVASNDGTKDLTTMISEVASNIGTADQLAGANNAGIKSTNTVNQNIMALDTALGNVDDLQQLGYGNVTEAIIGTNEVFSKAINQLDHNYRELRHHFEGGMASQAALSALVPNGRAKGDTQLSVGTGMYKGHTAAALGGFHWFTDNLLFNAGVAWDNTEATGRLGLTYSW